MALVVSGVFTGVVIFNWLMLVSKNTVYRKVKMRLPKEVWSSDYSGRL